MSSREPQIVPTTTPHQHLLLGSSSATKTHRCSYWNLFSKYARIGAQSETPQASKDNPFSQSSKKNDSSLFNLRPEGREVLTFHSRHQVFAKELAFGSQGTYIYIYIYIEFRQVNHWQSKKIRRWCLPHHHFGLPPYSYIRNIKNRLNGPSNHQ